jgi:hypothetical protein
LLEALLATLLLATADLAAVLALGFELLGDGALALALGLLFVDGLHEVALVFELVALGFEVELVVHVLVDLLGVTVSAEEATENTHAAGPDKLLGHAGLLGSLALTNATVAAKGFHGKAFVRSRAGVHLLRLWVDHLVFDEATHRLP